MSNEAPLLAPIAKIARFIEAGDDADLSGFADRDVVILENFAPHLLDGPDAVARWAQAMRAHLDGVTGLQHRFGPAQDVQVTGDRAFLSLPTQWTGVRNGHRFHEDGGWAFMLVRQDAEWRVRAYGWAVTRIVLE